MPLKSMIWIAILVALGGCSYETEPMNPSMRLGIGFSPDDRTARWHWEQPAEQFTLLEITAPGSETRVRLSSGDGEVVSVSRLPYLRSAPFFVCAESGDSPVAFELELESFYRLGEQAVGIKFYRVPEDSYANRERAHGLRKLCTGLAEREGEDAETWAENLSDLDAAAKALDATGESERALWAQYFATYFRYFPLHQYSEVIEAVGPIIDGADAHPKSSLKLLALQLKGQASLERDAEDDNARSRQMLKDALPSFEQAAQLARGAGNVFEEARALNNWGTALYYQDRPVESYEKHEQALELVKDDTETYLEDLYRENLSRASAVQGDTQAPPR